MNDDRFPSQELSSVHGRSGSSASAGRLGNLRSTPSVQSDTPMFGKRLSKVSRMAKEQ